MLYNSRMVPKKPNFKATWLGPYLVDWVQCINTLRVKDLAGILLNSVFNANKLKSYGSTNDDKESTLVKESVQDDQLEQVIIDVAFLHLVIMNTKEESFHEKRSLKGGNLRTRSMEESMEQWHDDMW